MSKNQSRPGIYTAVVKNNQDSTGQGRMQVFVPELGGDPNDPKAWYTASPMHRQAGSQPTAKSNQRDSGKPAATQEAHGTNAQAPFPNTQVIVMFAEDDPSRPIILGQLHKTGQTHTMGGYAAGNETEESRKEAEEYAKKYGVKSLPKLPVTEGNMFDTALNVVKQIRPVNMKLFKEMFHQGLLEEFTRGQMDTSPLRDLVPQFSSIKTAAGSFFTMDDGKLESSAGAIPDLDTRYYARTPRSGSHIKLRTDGGAQTLMNNDCGNINMISGDGSSWVEISEGGVASYSDGPISYRTEGNLNKLVDSKMISESKGTYGINAGGNITIHSVGDVLLSSSGSTAQLKAEGTLTFKAGGNIKSEGSSGLHFKSGGSILMTGSRMDEQNADPGAGSLIQSAPTNSVPDNGGGTDTVLPPGGLNSRMPAGSLEKDCINEREGSGEKAGESDNTKKQKLGDGSENGIDKSPRPAPEDQITQENTQGELENKFSNENPEVAKHLQTPMDSEEKAFVKTVLSEMGASKIDPTTGTFAADGGHLASAAGVGEVIFNRAENTGKTIQQVASAPAQFSGYKAYNLNRATQSQINAARQVYYGASQNYTNLTNGAYMFASPNAMKATTGNAIPYWGRGYSTTYSSGTPYVSDFNFWNNVPSRWGPR